VIYDLPVVFDLDAAAAGANFPYRWDPDYHARVGLLPRDGGGDDVTWFDVEPCYVFHPLNAYDDGDQVILDVVRHARMFATDRHGPNEGATTLDRWTLDIAAGKLREERFDDHSQELPRVDERRVGRRHRFGYAMTLSDGPNGLVKHDLEKGTSDVRADATAFAGEAVFVPRTPDAAEDDGWVMSIVYDAARDASDLLVLNAQDFTGEPQAVVHLPARVPYGFHGNWVPD
jgi:carotenoid cleavage dioxygenase